MRKIDPIVGDKFGDYIVISKEVGKSTDNHTTFKCQCKCGKIEFKISKNLRAGRSKMCKSCASKFTSINYPPPITFKKVGGLGSTFYSHIRRGAEKRGYCFETSQQYLWDLFVKQNGRCNLSGIDIYLSLKTKNSAPDYSLITASLDRINNDLGYTENNVQWIHKDINFMKQDYDQSYFVNMCKKIAANAA